MSTQKIEISHRTIVFTILFLLFLYGVYQIRGVILLVFISLILMSALNPAIDFLHRFKVPRIISIILYYILIIGFLSSVVASLIPPLVDQTSKLVEAIPSILDRLRFINIDTTIIFERLSTLPSNVFRFALSAFGNVVALLTVLVFTFYLLLERKNLKHHLTVAFGHDGEKKAEDFVDQLERRLGRWVRGQLFSMTLIGILTYIGLLVLNIEFALPLAILAALLEIIPNFGPILSAIPAIVIALATNPAVALGVTALYVVIQQVGAQLITPNIMRHAVGFNPLIVLIALLSGFSLAGIGGAVLAITTLLVAQLVFQTIYDNKAK